MTNVVGFLRKSLKRSTNAVRRVGKLTRKTVKRGTNAIGLTKRRKSRRGGRRHASISCHGEYDARNKAPYRGISREV